MKTKGVKFFSSIKYQLIVFILLSAQAIFAMMPFKGVGEYMRIYYLVDLSAGLASRTWVGTIVSLLTDHPTENWINAFAVAAVFLMIIMVSVLAGKIIRNVEQELRPQALIAALFLVSGTFTLYPFSAYLGLLDIHMFIIALAALVFLNNKILRWFVPVLCVAGFLVHQIFAATYFFMIVLAALYLIVAKNGKALNAALLVITIAVTAVTAVYVILNGENAISISCEELVKIIEEKSGHEFSSGAVDTLRMYFYYEPPEITGYTHEYLAEASIWDWIVGFFTFSSITYGIDFGDALSISAFMLVAISFFWTIWIMCIRNTETKGRKFVYICFMMSVFFVPVCSLVASDFIRWCQAGMLVQFSMVFFMFHVKDEPFRKTMLQLREFFSNKKLLLASIYILYALTVQMDLTA